MRRIWESGWARATCLAGLAVAVLAFGGAAMAADQAKDLVLKGDAVCTKCHDEGEVFPVLSIGRTKHGTQADKRTPTCTSCHGESRTHVNKPSDQPHRPPPDRVFRRIEASPAGEKPDRVFRKDSDTPPEEKADVCLGCHEGGNRMFWAGSQHETHDLACSNCHQVHTDRDKARDKKTQTEVCFNCHKQQRAQISKPSRHPIEEGKVACSDCHNPHGTAGVKLLVRDTVNDTCFQCHTEKRGPFLWEHQPVTDNCANCHNPHGTTTANLLKTRAPFLCLECHPPSSHRGNLPGVDFGGVASNAAGIGITLARACLNCHTNIHGSNNPNSATGSSAKNFRR